jgi:diacylglycerol kinase (ATP)
MAEPPGRTPGEPAGPPASIALVVNPSAAKGRAQTSLPQVVGRLRDAGHAVDIMLSRSPAEAADLVTSAAGSGADVLAVMGGDGMAHLGLNAVAAHATAHPGGPALALGLVPAGTGNDFARSLGLDPDDVDQATAALATGATRPVDLLRVDDRWVGTVLATGFDALVNARANRMRRPRGSTRYTIAVLAELRTFRPLPYALVVDGVARDLDAMFVAVGNTQSFGGGLRICPAADPYDGWLDVTIIHPVSRAKLLQLLPQMKTGRFASDPCVEQLRARSVTLARGAGIAYGDGEELGTTPVTATSVPGAIRICLPA